MFRTQKSTWLLIALLASFAIPAAAAPRRVLFDASHRENAGNADWVIDADLFDLNQPHFPCGGGDFENESRAQRFPTPPASAIGPTTDESYWKGGISAFGVDLVKLGFEVESLPPGGELSFGNGANLQDLGNYDVFVLPEPNRAFSGAEILAMRDFVAAGGGLFLIGDHQTSDRDCDGDDSPHILNDLMGVVVSGGSIADHGLFGIVFNVEEIAGLTSTDYWFTDAVDDNVTVDPLDPIVHGPHGDGTGGLGLFGSTSMTIDSASNPSVTAHIWKSDAVGQGSTRVTFATASYGNGRVAAIGDSSPADDGTGDSGDNLYLGWDKASGGVANKEIHLNAVEWLAGDDTTAPTITATPVAMPADCSALVAWTTDEPADGTVNYGPTAGYGQSASDPTPTFNPQVTLENLNPGALYHYSAVSSDPAGNPSLPSADATFTTLPAAAPVIVSGPTLSAIGPSSATIEWSTDEPASGRIDYGLTPAYDSFAVEAGMTTSHSLQLAGLLPESTYHFSVSSSDGCGNGPTSSPDDLFVTTAPEIDISGWTLRQFGSSQSFVFPAGTTIPGAGYLILGRDASLPAFEAEWGTLPVGTVYLDSGGLLPLINGGESFRLEDPLSAIVDGTTIALSAGQTIQRLSPSSPAGDASSWSVGAASFATPGAGAGPAAAAGVVINEASDASSFNNEFVELYYDAASSGPDTISPSTIEDLTATPLSDDAIGLGWTAPGDDGGSGTASSYDIRFANWPIVDADDFAAAAPLATPPAPSIAGSAESWEIPGFAPETTYYFAMRTLDDAGNLSGISNSVGATTGEPGAMPPGLADHPVISEIQTRGLLNASDEFIELHNPTAAAISVAGWSVQYKSATGTTYLRVDLPAVSIAAHGYLLLARPEYGGSVAADVGWSSFFMGAAGGHLFLVNSTAILGSCTDVSVVDKVGYGGADCPEADAAATHEAGESVERAPGAALPHCGNGIDSDDNGDDFDVRLAADPQNAASAGESPCISLGRVGNSLYFESGDSLRWASALGAAGYKIRRSLEADFMQTHPLPDDLYLLDQTTAPLLDDRFDPPSGDVFYYFVNATDGAGEESLD